MAAQCGNDKGRGRGKKGVFGVEEEDAEEDLCRIVDFDPSAVELARLGALRSVGHAPCQDINHTSILSA